MHIEGYLPVDRFAKSINKKIMKGNNGLSWKNITTESLIIDN